jgi:hypothetical protein
MPFWALLRDLFQFMLDQLLLAGLTSGALTAKERRYYIEALR